MPFDDIRFLCALNYFRLSRWGAPRLRAVLYASYRLPPFRRYSLARLSRPPSVECGNPPRMWLACDFGASDLGAPLHARHVPLSHCGAPLALSLSPGFALPSVALAPPRKPLAVAPSVLICYGRMSRVNRFAD